MRASARACVRARARACESARRAPVLFAEARARAHRERVCQLLLSLRPVERENEHPLDELVVERRCVELAHAAERFGRVRRGEVLANLQRHTYARTEKQAACETHSTASSLDS
eukprot:4159529-Pleurochrysis_carterae.AAC.1